MKTKNERVLALALKLKELDEKKLNTVATVVDACSIIQTLDRVDISDIKRVVNI